MAYNYTDITERGIRVVAAPSGATSFLDPVYGLTSCRAASQAMFVRACDVPSFPGLTVAVGKLHDTDETCVMNSDGVWAILGPNHGNQAHTVVYYGEYRRTPESVGQLCVRVVWVQADGWYDALVTVANLHVVLGPQHHPFPWPETPSEGFLDLAADGTPLWTHENRIYTVWGEQLFYPLHRGDWVVGQHGPTLSVVAYHKPSDYLYHAWDGETQAPPRINTSGQVAVSAEPDRELFVNPSAFESFIPYVDEYPDNKLVGTIWANSDRYGYHEHGGNCETFFEGDYGRVAEKLPVIIGGNALNVPPSAVLGHWRTDEPPVGTRSFVYHDGRSYPADLMKLLRPQDLPLFQAYPEPGESPEAFSRSMATELNRDPRPKMIVAAFYDRNGTLPIDQLLPHMWTYDAMLRRPDVLGMLAFDYARSGIHFHNVLQAWYDAFTAATPGIPTLPPPQPEKPKVLKTTISHLVSSFEGSDFDQPVGTRHAATKGPWELVDVVLNSDGTYSIRNEKGTEWLSVQREGTIQSRPTSDPQQPRSWEKFDRKENTLVERNKDQYGGFVPAGRPPVTFLVAGDL